MKNKPLKKYRGWDIYPYLTNLYIAKDTGGKYPPKIVSRDLDSLMRMIDDVEDKPAEIHSINCELQKGAYLNAKGQPKRDDPRDVIDFVQHTIYQAEGWINR